MLLSHRQSQRKKKEFDLKKTFNPYFLKENFIVPIPQRKFRDPLKKLIPLINPKKPLNPLNQKFPLAPI